MSRIQLVKGYVNSIESDSAEGRILSIFVEMRNIRIDDEMLDNFRTVAYETDVYNLTNIYSEKQIFDQYGRAFHIKSERLEGWFIKEDNESSYFSNFLPDHMCKTF